MAEGWLWMSASMGRIYMMHALLALLFVVVGTMVLRRRYSDAPYKIAALLFVLEMAMPIVGYLFGAWLIYYLRTVRYEKRLTHTRYIDMDDFQPGLCNRKKPMIDYV